MIELYVGINLAIFVNRSIMMRIMSFPNADFDTDPKLFMSMDSQDHSGIDNGCNRPAGG